MTKVDTGIQLPALTLRWISELVHTLTVSYALESRPRLGDEDITSSPLAPAALAVVFLVVAAGANLALPPGRSCGARAVALSEVNTALFPFVVFLCVTSCSCR